MNKNPMRRMAARFILLFLIALIGLACLLPGSADPIFNQTATAVRDPIQQKTLQYSGMLQKVQLYAGNKYLPSTSGSYQHLNDQILYFSKVDYYKWTYVGLELDDFALESDLIWENTTETSGKYVPGCAFMFHSNGSDVYSLVLFGLDGNVYLDYINGADVVHLAKARFGRVEISKGNAHIALIVNGNQYTFLVNDKMIVQSVANEDVNKTGSLAYTVFSGSNVGVGTTCKFTNIDLWTVRPSKPSSRSDSARNF